MAPITWAYTAGSIRASTSCVTLVRRASPAPRARARGRLGRHLRPALNRTGPRPGGFRPGDERLISGLHGPGR